MYQDFFSLHQAPFSIVADPHFLFFSDQHKEALAHLTYGLQGNGGFVVLTGEIGTGKTSVCRYLLQNMPADTDIASITQQASNNDKSSEIALLVEICEQLSVQFDHQNITLKVMFDALTSWMLDNHQRGRHAIVLIDEAQHLSFNALEQLRLLTNIESDNIKPLQIILVGQTALQQRLLTTELRQLSQRITARYHLSALNKQETTFYIHHRLSLSGANGPIFDPKTITLIFKASQGIPRLINQICDRCLLSAYTQSSQTISVAIAKKAINEAELPQHERTLTPVSGRLIATIAVAILLVIATILLILPNNLQSDLLVQNVTETKQQALQNEWSTVINSAQQLPNKNNAKDTFQKITDNAVQLTPLATLLEMPSDNYSLQLSTFDSTQSIVNFFADYPQLRTTTMLYQVTSSTAEKYVLIQGSFSTYKMAKQASKALTNDFPEIDPWIKDYETLCNEIQ